MKGITNDVYGQNMNRKQAEPKITPKKRKPFWVKQDVSFEGLTSHEQDLARENEELSAKQRKG